MLNLCVIEQLVGLFNHLCLCDATRADKKNPNLYPNLCFGIHFLPFSRFIFLFIFFAASRVLDTVIIEYK